MHELWVGGKGLTEGSAGEGGPKGGGRGEG